MADILIFGMKMPENEQLRLVLNPNGQLFVDHGVTFTEYEAIELPEHGDLIDLSELQKFPIRLDHYDKEHGDEHFVYGIESLMEYAECLPVIIPASKEESE